MYNYISWIVLTTILITDCSDAVPLSDFFSFGQAAGDVQFVNIHRAASSAIAIPTGFPYFNTTNNVIYVSLYSIMNFLLLCTIITYCLTMCMKISYYAFPVNLSRGTILVLVWDLPYM